MLNNYDFACASERAQEFEGLMPKAAEAAGECGTELVVLDIEAAMENAEVPAGADFVGLVPTVNAVLGTVIGEELEIVDVVAVAEGEAGASSTPAEGSLVNNSVVLPEGNLSATATSLTVTYKVYEKDADTEEMVEVEKTATFEFDANETIEDVEIPIEIKDEEENILYSGTVKQSGYALLAEMYSANCQFEERINTSEIKSASTENELELTDEIIAAATTVADGLVAGTKLWAYDTDMYCKANGFDVKVTDGDTAGVYTENGYIYFKGGRTGDTAYTVVVPEGVTLKKMFVDARTKKSASSISVNGEMLNIAGATEVSKEYDLANASEIKIETGEKKVYAHIKIYGLAD